MSCCFLGIMSGTSCDGIDIAVMDLQDAPRLCHFQEHPMPADIRRQLLSLMQDECASIDAMGKTGRLLGMAYARAVMATLDQAGIRAKTIAAIGCHGQTIRHRPDATPAFTLQIGCAATLAGQTGITTVADFRSRDIAAGGCGAPLVPFAHQQLFAAAGGSTAVLNIGGISNLTWLGANHDVTGFDCGPGNMIMDGLMQRISNGRYSFDHDGAMAAAGRVCEPLLAKLMQHPFIHRPPPKSTGREDFGDAVIASIMDWPDISDADRMATACAFTVHSIASQRRFLPQPPERWLVCGGGARNRYLMQQLIQTLAPARVQSTAEAGMPPQAVEAACFAMLAKQALLGAPNTLAAVTGATHDVCGGSITPGRNWRKLLQDIPRWTR